MRIRNWLKIWAKGLKAQELRQLTKYADNKNLPKEFKKPKLEKLWTPPM